MCILFPQNVSWEFILKGVSKLNEYVLAGSSQLDSYNSCVKGEFWYQNNFRLNQDLDNDKHLCPIFTARQFFMS